MTSDDLRVGIPATSHVPGASLGALGQAAPYADIPIRALVVDDDAAIRETLRYLLEDAGWEVQEAVDGPSALGALRSAPCRMVALLDQVMPGLSGQELLHSIANDPDLAERHAYLIVTASSHIEVLEADLQRLPSIVAPVIRKPFDITALVDAVDQSAARLAARERME